MKKNGFTLVELLVVIAIIGILSIIIVPSVINVNKNVNNRLLDQKKEHIETGATLYASKNDEIFNGVDEVYVYVYELIDMGYVTIDVDKTDSRCTPDTAGDTANMQIKGCVLDPTSDNTLNKDYVILRKQGAAGYTAEYVYNGSGGSTEVASQKKLYEAVCEGFANGNLTGKAPNGNQCYCYNASNQKVGTGATTLKDSSGSAVSACIISGENPNNYLKYGDSKPNWRVLGVYKVGSDLVAKMITSEPI